MRHIGMVVLSLACVACAATTSLSAPLQAANMTPTIYDDGKSCPNNCDAHVVFHPTHNGTRNAFHPSSSRSAPAKCVAGQKCTICFSKDDSSCMSAMYRGAGPDVGRFDFTPAFYEENCSKPDLPAAFARQCQSAKPALEILNKQINCVANPQHEKCTTLMGIAARRKAADDLLYDECKSMGEAVFNRKHSGEPKLQRSNDCAYEKIGTGGPNSRGQRWRRLLDGACRAGTYAGRDGLDCCSGSLFSAAMLGRECKIFFVDK